MCTYLVTLGHAVIQCLVVVLVALATSVDEGEARAGAGLVEEAREGCATRSRLGARQAVVWRSEVNVSPDNETLCSVAPSPLLGLLLAYLVVPGLPCCPGVPVESFCLSVSGMTPPQ